MASGSGDLELSFEYANENRQATIGLGGTGVAILTFLLVFLSARADGGGYEAVLFRATLGTVVLSIFFLSLAGTYYYLLLEALERKLPNPLPYLHRADAMFVVGLALLLLEPSLILYAVQIYDVGTLALGLWVVSLLVIG